MEENKKQRIRLKRGVYKDIFDFAQQNNLLKRFNDEVNNGSGRNLQDYLENYSDRPIVYRFLRDALYSYKGRLKWKCSDVETDWHNVKITVYETRRRKTHLKRRV